MNDPAGVTRAHGTSRLRLVFLGTAELACASLAALAEQATFELAAVVTQPDRPQGRSLQPAPSPVKRLAAQLRLPVLQPERCRAPEFQEAIRSLQPDLMVVAAYGQILPQSLLEVPRLGCLNVHASLLPRHRGAAPIQWAILHDDAETGVTIMKVDAGLDTGDILALEHTPIHDADDARALHDRLADMGARLLVKTIPEFVAGRIIPQPQPAEGATYARKIAKEDGRIDWTQPARALWNRVRAFTPWPGAYSYLPGRDRPVLVKFWRAGSVAESGAPGRVLRADPQGIVIAAGEGALRVTELQREGGRRMGAADFLAGHPLASQARFE